MSKIKYIWLKFVMGCYREMMNSAYEGNEQYKKYKIKYENAERKLNGIKINF